MRVWKLDLKLKSFSLAGTVPIPGVVNSLQFISAPKHFTENTSWATPKPRHSAIGPPSAPITCSNPAAMADLATKNKPSVSKVPPVLVVVGVGQEHRLGRWLTLKGNGTVNCAFVVAFFPRTL